MNDIIIVGAGTAGCVLAERMSNSGKLRVLLIEAGGKPSSPFVKIPAGFANEAFAFTRSHGAPGTPPDIELIFVPFEWRNEGLEAPKIDAFGIAPVVVAPRSRGHLRLRSANPLDAPLIDFGLFTDPEGLDAAAIVAGARLARKIAATPPLAGYLVEEVFPGAAINDDAALLASLNTQLQTVYHPTSTCRKESRHDRKLNANDAVGKRSAQRNRRNVVRLSFIGNWSNAGAS
jgi:choline dehydrogenase-like flavoprotein